MSIRRTTTLKRIIRGLIPAVGVTLIAMVVVAGIALLGRLPDSLLSVLNQVVKIIAILTGVAAAVGRGGRQGFVTGMVIAILYMVIGYALYVALGGGSFSTLSMLSEILIGAAVGGLFGAILSNMNPKHSGKRK